MEHQAVYERLVQAARAGNRDAIDQLRSAEHDRSQEQAPSL